MNFFLWAFKLRLKVRQLRKQIRQLQALVYTDDVTPAKSRRGLYAALEALEKDARKRGVINRYGLLLVDINHFKTINDTYGHEAGDEVLCDVVRKTKVRDGDVIARLGGDEFAVILLNCRPEHVLDRAKQLQESLATRCLVNGVEEVGYDCSVGCSTFKTTEDLPQALLKGALSTADQSMYRVKRANRVIRDKIALVK